MFCILNPTEPKDFHYLADMHHLRYKIFYNNLKWEDGLKVHSQMEFDEYDHHDARYLIRVNENNNVDACARLTPTDKPYLLGCSFPQFITDVPTPASSSVYEISRLCADNKTAPRNITGLLMAAILEFGIANHIKEFVSLSDVRIIPRVKRFGWQANTIGPALTTRSDTSVALRYEVTSLFQANVNSIVGNDLYLHSSVHQNHLPNSNHPIAVI